ncbi:WD-repeat protein (Modular protein) [Planktothrix agardhii]|uniref:NB-ARC domain-containing protein n=1 Tax=Planktothrix agardhii TaxID=1160 RepID=UPI001BA0E7A8|nr:NB-ARC domain-containing protein [Planktothrix agardhii]CAD0230939.1 WD-repeat protein (Modular protein) [Planktothrix agardhii]
MNLKEVLKMADEMVFAKTGQHLDNLQEAILQGTMQGDKYIKIAEEIHCNENYVRQVGSQLWQILSEELGEEVSKSNVRSVMGRFIFENVSNFENVAISSFNTCGQSRHPPNIPNSPPPNQETPNTKQPEISHQDLSEMPDLGTFYDRTPELETLTTWILQAQCRLIAITGISGIGKTSLAVQIVQQIKNQFDYIIWRTIDPSHNLDEFQQELIQLFSQSEKLDSPTTKPKPLSLIKYLQKHRCLIILDDVHNLFSSGELAGKYKPEYEEYRHFFKQIEKLSHQSCFLLIGWEQPREISQIESQNNPIRTLQITGLDIAAAGEILRDYGLAEIDYSILIHRYQGNPLWLKSVATLIQELGVNVTDLLQNDTILLPEDVKDILRQQCDRLSDREKQILSILARETQPLKLAKLIDKQPNLNLELVNVLQSLQRRCLVEKIEDSFWLPPLIKQYFLI